jgi:hypothetical protein
MGESELAHWKSSLNVTDRIAISVTFTKQLLCPIVAVRIERMTAAP